MRSSVASGYGAVQALSFENWSWDYLLNFTYRSRLTLAD